MTEKETEARKEQNFLWPLNGRLGVDLALSHCTPLALSTSGKMNSVVVLNPALSGASRSCLIAPGEPAPDRNVGTRGRKDGMGPKRRHAAQ